MIMDATRERAVATFNGIFQEHGLNEISFSFKSTPPGLTHLLGRLSPNPGESTEKARRRFYRRMFGILWLSLTRYQYPSQPSFEASHNAHSLRWKTRLLASMVSSLEPMAIGSSFEEIIKRVAKCQKCLCIVPRKPFS